MARGYSISSSNNNENNDGDEDHHHRRKKKTLVCFLQDNIEWNPGVEKMYHFTYEFNPKEGSTYTLCETNQPIKIDTEFEEVTLDKIEDKIEKLVGYPHSEPFDRVHLCVECSKEARQMKKEEENKNNNKNNE